MMMKRDQILQLHGVRLFSGQRFFFSFAGSVCSSFRARISYFTWNGFRLICDKPSKTYSVHLRSQVETLIGPWCLFYEVHMQNNITAQCSRHGHSKFSCLSSCTSYVGHANKPRTTSIKLNPGRILSPQLLFSFELDKRKAIHPSTFIQYMGTCSPDRAGETRRDHELRNEKF